MQLKILQRNNSLAVKGVLFMKIAFKSIIAITSVLLICAAVSNGAQNKGDQTAVSEKTPKAFLPVTTWEFEPVVDGQEVVHEFAIQNKGDAPLNVEQVKTG